MRDFEAVAFADFLGKILKWHPKDRPKAQDMLNHYWLKMIPNYNSVMSRRELKEYLKVHNYSVSPSEKEEDKGEKEDDDEDDEENNKRGIEGNDGDDNDWENDDEGDDHDNDDEDDDDLGNDDGYDNNDE
jgi:serine/threonine protein kinase